MSNTLETLLSRRSVLANEMHEPGPTKEQVEQILAAAHRVPDHGKIGPWRFILFCNEAREEFGQFLGEIYAKENPEAAEKLLQFEAKRFMRAPLAIAVVASPQEHPKVPEWEQILSAGAACQNILLAATSMGFGAQWLTEWYSYNAEVDTKLELQSNEKIAGFIYLGSKSAVPKERVRPSLDERIRYWSKKA